MALVQFVTNLDLDDQTVDELRALRSIQFETTKNLLDNIDQTLQELIEMEIFHKTTLQKTSF